MARYSFFLVFLLLATPLLAGRMPELHARQLLGKLSSPVVAEENELFAPFSGEMLKMQLLQHSGGKMRTGVWLHALSPFGDVKYPPNFDHFEYVNPNAPKGGVLRQHDVGTFDSLNGFILKGRPAQGINVIYDTLLEASSDEPFSRYGLLAEKVMVTPDQRSVHFKLRPEARWHDGEPITADDVVFSFNILMEKGHPLYAQTYRDVEKVEALSPQEVRFSFKTNENRELPLLVGELPIIPKHFWIDKDFTRSGTAIIPLGSGAYRIGKFAPGRSIEFERVPDYWGKDLPLNRGRNNFDKMTIDYYRDATVALEAFKAGAYDLRLENVARDWARAYNFPAMREGRARKETILHAIPTGMQAFVFNTRRPLFSDVRVREALSLAYDFEWANKTLFFSLYTRTQSYFSNSFYASTGKPLGKELAMLEPYRNQLPARVFDTQFLTSKTDGSGFNRDNLLEARDLLKAAGWNIKDGKLVNEKGEIFTFQVLLSAPNFERVLAPFLKNLQRLGIQATMRTVDSSQYQKRLENYDYDMVMHVFGQSLFPGNEQLAYWHSSRADIPGGVNIAGIKNPVVDALTEKLVTAQDLETLIDSARALDRVLLWNFYVIPNWHSRNFRIAYWNKFGRPDKAPIYSIGLENWWAKAMERKK